MPTVAWKCSIAQLGNCPGSLLSLSESSIGCLVTSPSCAPPGCGLIDPLHPFQIAQSSNSTSNSRDELTQSNLLVSWSLILPEHHWNHNSTQHCTGSHSDHSIDHCPSNTSVIVPYQFEESLIECFWDFLAALLHAFEAPIPTLTHLSDMLVKIVNID